MKTSLTSIYGAATTGMAVIGDLLWQVSPRRFRMASTSEELLDLFEEKYAVQDELLPVTSSNHEGKTPESASLAQPLIWLPRETNWKPRSPGAFISDGKPTGSLCFQSFTVNEGS